MNPELTVKISKLQLKNPVMVASGTLGYAEEFKDFLDLRKLGAIVTKTLTLNPRKGNLPSRTCETPSGMLNSIGLENPGLEVFIDEKLPFLKKIGVPIIASISSEEDPHEFVELTHRIDKIKEIVGIELNISCPNIKVSGLAGRKVTMLISQDPRATYNLVKVLRKVTKKTLITKLSPNVTDITSIARAAEAAGTDAVSLVNTFLGMKIDIEKMKPALGNITGGLSGPAIRPIALRMVWEVARIVKIPVIGIGGIMNTDDALEFIIAGASAIEVGTANFVNPKASLDIIKGIEVYLRRKGIKDINRLRKIL